MSVCGLDGLNVLGLPALWTFGHVELHLLPFLQAAKAARLYGGEMHEDVLTTLTADEAIAFGVVKPLYCSYWEIQDRAAVKCEVRAWLKLPPTPSHI